MSGMKHTLVMNRALFKRTPQFSISPAPADYEISVSRAEFNPRIMLNPISWITAIPKPTPPISALLPRCPKNMILIISCDFSNRFFQIVWSVILKIDFSLTERISMLCSRSRSPMSFLSLVVLNSVDGRVGFICL